MGDYQQAVSDYSDAIALRREAWGRLAADLDPDAVFELVSAWELRTYMADVLLRDSDVMSMRHSLELRVPLVDRPLIEWLWHQPAAFKHDPRQPKSALHGALRDLLPPSLGRRAKWGFSLPMDTWMRRDLRPFLEEVFSAPSIARSGFFNVPAIESSWREYLTRYDSREWSRIWNLAVLIAFINRRPTPATSGCHRGFASRRTPSGASAAGTIPESFSAIMKRRW